MPRRHPPLTPDEVIAILRSRGFSLDRTAGSHAQYVGSVRGRFRRVTIDLHYREFDDQTMRRLMDQSGLTREEFYGSTKETARKIGLRADEYPIPLQ
jgi:predicted RNA binding protein YcfA (HicA-like mRNA interferase family)